LPSPSRPPCPRWTSLPPAPTPTRPSTRFGAGPRSRGALHGRVVIVRGHGARGHGVPAADLAGQSPARSPLVLCISMVAERAAVLPRPAHPCGRPGIEAPAPGRRVAPEPPEAEVVHRQIVGVDLAGSRSPGRRTARILRGRPNPLPRTAPPHGVVPPQVAGTSQRVAGHERVQQSQPAIPCAQHEREGCFPPPPPWPRL